MQGRDERPSGRWAERRAAGAAAAVVALLLVVAFGDASPLHTDPGANRVAADVAVFPLFVLLGAAAAAAVTSTILARRRMVSDLERDDADPGPGGRSWLLRFALLLVPFAVAGALIFAIAIRPHAPPQPQGAEPRPSARAPDANRSGRDDWRLVALVGGAVAAGAAFGATQWRRRSRRTKGIAPLRRPADADDPSAALDAALAALEGDPDPRRAIIAAYVRMERALDAAGLGRREPEAPREYLARVAGALGGDARAARRLTALYEEARFSVHAVDEGMRAEAVAALQGLRPEAVA